MRADLPADVVAYVTNGMATGETRDENRRALDRWRIMPTSFVDVSDVATTQSLLDRDAALPLAIAPMAGQRMVHPDGELAMARAAARAGVPMILSLSITVPVEDIGAVPGLDLWFQLYPFTDPEANRTIVARAVAAGARAVVLTVDMPPPGRQAPRLPAVVLPPGVAYAHHGADPVMSASIVWDDLVDLVGWAGVPVVVKGVLDGRAARRAVELGAAGVVVSNHGGRVLDGMIAAADALAAMGPLGAPRFLDGGIATGTDILRALALGAQAALVGRTVLWALAAGGESGVFDELSRIHAEFEQALAVAGATSPSQVTVDHVRRQ